MSRELLAVGLLVLSSVFGLSCATTAQQKSTGTNWIECKFDGDCEKIPGARCGSNDVCIDGNGKSIDASALPSAPDGGQGAGGTGGGVSAEAGTGSTGVAVPTSDCYSPGQNLDRVLSVGVGGAHSGCRCTVSGLESCIRDSQYHALLECYGGHWLAVDDGPCWNCWTPDTPELAVAFPDNGCACPTEDASACFFASSSAGNERAVCLQGKWTIDTSKVAGCDTCESDARCGLGGKCTDGHCAGTACEVDGVKYAMGATNIPDPFSCNTCECGPLGLSCTNVDCPVACPAGTVPGTACLGMPFEPGACGFNGGCPLRRIGCLPICQTSADCAGTATPYCDPGAHVCTVTSCI